MRQTGTPAAVLRSHTQPYQRDEDLRVPWSNALRDRAAHHGYFVARVEIGAVHAILVYLVRQLFSGGGNEPHMSEELRDARKQANAGHAMLFRLVEQRLYQPSAGAGAFGRRHDRDTADLSQVHAV